MARMLHGKKLQEIFSLDLRRSANFGSRDSCVEDAVYHHRFETRAQLRYCIKVVSQPVNPLPFLRRIIVLNIKRMLYHTELITFHMWISPPYRRKLFLRISSEKSIYVVSTFLDEVLSHQYEYWLQNCITTQIEFDCCG